MISIAMTTYNGEKYLREQLDSILTQTYKNFELIICDDCSKDKTRKILTEYEQKDNRIKIYFNEENLGFKKNFEKAISFCNGDYIAFCDQDDVWNSTKLELSLSEIKSYSLLCTNAELTDSNLKPLGYTMKDSITIPNFTKDNLEILKNLIHHNFVQGATILAKSVFIKKYLPIPKDVIFHDWYYAVCAMCENGIKYLDNCTIKYRQHQSNVTENKKNNLGNLIKPVIYDKERILKDTNQKLFFLNFVVSKSKASQSDKYFKECKKYLESLPEKKFYTLIFINKYFKYIHGDKSFFSKRIILLKHFIGYLKFKFFIKRKYFS